MKLAAVYRSRYITCFLAHWSVNPAGRYLIQTLMPYGFMDGDISDQKMILLLLLLLNVNLRNFNGEEYCNQGLVLILVSSSRYKK